MWLAGLARPAGWAGAGRPGQPGQLAVRPIRPANTLPLINHPPGWSAASRFCTVFSWIGPPMATTCALIYTRLLINIRGYDQGNSNGFDEGFPKESLVFLKRSPGFPWVAPPPSP